MGEKMKKVILALMLTLFMVTGVLAQQLRDGFETWPSPNWNLIETNEFNPIIRSNVMPHSGDYSLRFSSYTSTTGTYDQYMVSNELDWTEDSNEFSFYYRSHTMGTESFAVGWSTDGNDVEDDFTWIEVTNISMFWDQYVKTDLPYKIGRAHV